MRPARVPVCAVTAFVALFGGAIHGEAADEPGVVALVGGEVRPVDGPALAVGTVLLRAGRIEAVGHDVAIPAGAHRIDCTGCVVTPGLVDADSALPVDWSDRFLGRVTADARIADAVRRDDERLDTARRQGVTAFHVTGNARSSVGGLAAVVANAAPTEVLLDGSGLAVHRGGADASGGLWGAQRLAEIRMLFVAARDRRDEIDRWRRDLRRFEERRLADEPTKEERLLLPADLLETMRRWTPEQRAAWREGAYKSMGREKEWTKPKTLPKPPTRPGNDAHLDTVIATLDAKSEPGHRVLFRTESATDVAAALALAKEFGLAPVLLVGEGAAASALELARARVAVVITEAADMAQHDDGPLSARAPGLAARLVAAGLHPALGAGGGGGGSRFLRLIAAREIGEGLAPEDALRAVTLWAAESAGVADRIGTLSPGKRADVVVWTGDPFAAATRAKVVVVGGEIVHE